MSRAVALDLFVNGVALAALVLAWTRTPGKGAVDRRLRGVYSGLALLVASRMLDWATGWSLFGVVTLIAAGCFPILILRLVEELRRRHAPAPLKWLAAGGGVGFGALALILGVFWPEPLMAGIAAFQIVVLGWLGALIVRRRPGDLSPAEGATLDSLAVVIALALPLLATDFRSLFPQFPVRMGAVAILIFVVATVRLVTTGGRPAALLADLAMLASGAMLITTGAAITGVRGATMLLGISAVALAAGALLVCAMRLNDSRRRQRGRTSVLSALAELPAGARASAVIGRHPDLAAGRLIEGAGFGLYDEAALTRILARQPVVSAATSLDPLDRPLMDDLLATHAASHVVLCRDAPLRLLAVSMGALANAGAEQELALLSRLLRAETA